MQLTTCKSNNQPRPQRDMSGIGGAAGGSLWLGGGAPTATAAAAQRGAACPAGELDDGSGSGDSVAKPDCADGSSTRSSEDLGRMNNKAAGTQAGDASDVKHAGSDTGHHHSMSSACGAVDGSGTDDTQAAADFAAAFDRVVEAIGPPDYILVGAGWRVAAHREVLRGEFLADEAP
jgi:hypothetical protein